MSPNEVILKYANINHKERMAYKLRYKIGTHLGFQLDIQGHEIDKLSYKFLAFAKSFSASALLFKASA